MFESFYGLTANPFRMSADENFRYAHRTYIKAWSYLTYALEQAEGFVLITGKPGTGKTTLIRNILSELDSERVRPVTLVTNLLQGEELLRLVALEFGFPAQDFNKATLLTRIEEYALGLYKQGRRVVVIVDEAQNLSAHGLEELRLLSNLQAGNQSLFQIVLVGQEEIRSLIYGQGVENIQQRIVASCRLLPMQAEQVQGYIEHRLGIVGWDGDPSLDPAIYELLYRITHGVPREINLVTARLLLYGSLEKMHALNKTDLLVVLSELDQEKRLAFDQTAILAELYENAEAAESGFKAVSEEIAGRQPEAEDQLADTTQSHEQDAEVELVEEGVAASCEVASPTVVPTDFRFTPAIADGECEAKPNEPEEWIGLTAPRDRGIDELATVRVARDDDRPGPQGLLTDVDELLGRADGVIRDRRTLWRWIFYPLAIGLVLVALLVPKPSDLHTLWYALWHQVKDADVTLQSRDSGLQNRREVAVGNSVQTPSAVVTKPETPETAPAQAGSTEGDRLPLERGEVAKAQELAGWLLEAEPVAERSSRGEPLIIEIDRPHPMIFEASGSELNIQSQLRLGRLAAWLQVNPTTMVVITGIAKAGDQPMVRMRLALQRAEWISARLVSEGISASRIVIEGGYPDNMPAEAGACVRLKPMPDEEDSKTAES